MDKLYLTVDLGGTRIRAARCRADGTIESRTEQFTRAEEGANAVVERVAESLRVVSGRAQDKNLELDADIESTISVVADRRATKQILVNLLSNAVKFTQEGGKVVVRSQLLSDRIVLLIADTGIGIAPQSLKRLGRPFEQVESQLTKTYHGSGLGLAIARSLTELHGGSMKLRSRLGNGTVVRVVLPRDPRYGKENIQAAA